VSFQVLLLNQTKTFSVLINDLQGSIYLYNNKGVLIKECKLGQTININEKETIIFSEFLTSTGLQIKADPGLRLVYFSFLLLMISTYTSFISYSQIWGAENLAKITVAGNSNRAVLFFQTEFRKLVTKTSLSIK
jgi:cytochrome c biogenesis protein